MASPERALDSSELDAWIAAIREADASAIARALDCVEDTRPRMQALQRALLAGLSSITPREHSVVGLTGPPGAGKSTLAGALIQHWLAQGLGVGVTAIDPSSQRSGGALLGDRTRLRLAADARAFVRSMAARDQLGGLAPATRAAAHILRAAFEWTLVETVGVGQSEVAIESVADLVVLVLQPGSGDMLQFMKAGVLEIPDVVVVHKWDVGAAAERTRSELEATLALQPHDSRRLPPVVLGVSAQSGHGVAELAAALAKRRDVETTRGRLDAKREAANVTWALELFVRRYGSYGVERLGGGAAARARAASLSGTGLERFSALAKQTGLDD